jgi:phosphoribosylaminoimidazole carboxylase
MLSVGIPRLADEIEKYSRTMEEEVLKKLEKIESIGWEEYTKKK